MRIIALRGFARAMRGSPARCPRPTTHCHRIAAPSIACAKHIHATRRIAYAELSMSEHSLRREVRFRAYRSLRRAELSTAAPRKSPPCRSDAMPHHALAVLSEQCAAFAWSCAANLCFAVAWPSLWRAMPSPRSAIQCRAFALHDCDTQCLCVAVIHRRRAFHGGANPLRCHDWLGFDSAVRPESSPVRPPHCGAVDCRRFASLS